MGGGLMQLVAYGAQDVYLVGNPQITFWKVTYRRHTNFSMESIEQTFNGQADFGRRVTCTISRNGDLAYRTYLQVTLPEINQSMATVSASSPASLSNGVYARWLDFPGEHLCDLVEVEIGGQRIDRQYSDWMHIWNQLTLSKEQERGYYKMIGHTTQLTYICDPSFASIDGPCSDNTTPSNVCAPRNALPESTLYIPLQFWFCRNPGLALPLIALQYHEVKIIIELRHIDQCLWAVKTLYPGDATTSQKVDAPYNQSLVSASLFVDYIFLDTDERRRMATNPHEYLIEQLQYTGDESVGSSSNKIKLNFNHPCKELIWVVQKDEHIDYCQQYKGGDLLYLALGAQPFNYTDAIDALPPAIHAFGSKETLTGTSGNGNYGVIGATGLFETAFAVSVTGPTGTDSFSGWNPNAGVGGEYGANYPAGLGGAASGINESAGLTDAGVFVLAETALDMHCWGENPVVTAKLQLNGQDRFSDREGSYFDLVQPWQHHTRNPDTGINVYSFALRPEEHQPSGTCNFSRIDNAYLQLLLSNSTVTGTQTAKVRVYAVSYNVLRIMSGMGGLNKSNNKLTRKATSHTYEDMVWALLLCVLWSLYPAGLAGNVCPPTPVASPFLAAPIMVC